MVHLSRCGSRRGSRRRSRETFLVAGALFVAASFACGLGAMVIACSSSDAPANDAPKDAGVDTSARTDASMESGARSDASDAGGSDARIDDASILDATCAPSSDPYVAKWRPPHPRASVCTSDDLEMFWVACWNGGIRNAACTSFTTAHAACGLCIVSSSDDATRGALAVFTKPDLVSLNAPGCIALVEGDASAGGCAAADQALHDCKVEICGTCATKGDAGAAFTACEATAQSGECAGYKSAFDAKCAELSGATGGLAVCLGTGLSTHDYFTRIAGYFCGGVDGG